MEMMKGWKTIGMGLLMVIAPPALTYLAGVDWSHIVGPSAAFAISGVIMMALRVVTTTPVGKSDSAKPVSTGGPSSSKAGAIGALIAAIFLAGLMGQAKAADVAGKAAPVAFVPCSQATGCYGWYAGGVIAGNTQSSNVIAGGLNSITTGEQNLGVDGGYLWANGTWMFGADVSIAGTINGSPIAAGYSAPKWLSTQTFEVGGALTSLFGGIKAADTTGLNAQILANIITPFIEIGAIERSWGAGVAYGGGIIFAIDNQHWFGKVDYLHATFSNVSCSPIQTCNSVDLVRASIDYKF